MTIKPELGSPQAPVPAVDSAPTATAPLFDFGAPSATRKRLFQFAKRSRKPALGPSRSEYGCD